MNPESFFLSGAVMSMPDGKIYYGSQFQPTTIATGRQVIENKNHQPAEFINPHYNLKNPKTSMTPKSLTADSGFLNPLVNESDLESINWVSDIKVYEKTYQQFILDIQAGIIKKAVPFATYQAKKPKDFNQHYLPLILNKLAKVQSQDQFLYGSWDSGSGFIGQTPEILIEKKHLDTMYASMALAGTLASDSADDMLKDPKLLDEHQLVIDDISEKLHDHRLFWGQTFEKKYGAIKHLCSHLEFASTLNLHSIIARLSPTSAVGTYPSALWTKYQDLLQAHTRAAYGAPFGLVMPEQTRIVVCLRGLFWDEGFLYIHVGGGITAQSDYKTEINELELKFKSTKAKLGL